MEEHQDLATMRIGWKPALLLLIGLAVIIGCHHLGLFDGINRFCYDTSFRLRGPAPPSRDIIIAAVDEKTLQDLGRWPLARHHYAKLLGILGNARAVGFTIIMGEPDEGDELLASAARSHGRVVAPVYIDERMRLEYPATPLRAISLGHIHVEIEPHGMVRKVFHTIGFEDKKIPSFASALRDASRSRSPVRAGLTQGDMVPPGIIAQSDPMGINYYGPPGSYPTVSMSDIISGRVHPDLFRDRIVLVGPTAGGVENRVSTPFSGNRNLMSSVELQANITENLLRSEGVTAVGEWPRLAACLALALALTILFLRLEELGSLLLWSGTMVLVSLTCHFCLIHLHLWIEPDLYYFVPAFLFLALFLIKLDASARRLAVEYSLIAQSLGLPSSNGHAASHLNLPRYLSLGGVNAQARILAATTRQLMERANQLEASNRELEAFSYAVSHDLRSPLRGIIGYSSALLEDCAPLLDNTCRVYLDRINLAVLRMERLIEGLLNLSRLSRAELLKEQIDLSDMVHEITADLQYSEPSRQTEFVIQEGIAVDADANLLRVVMVNLLENAWKFTARNDKTIIEFGSDTVEGERRFFIKDNGAGFDAGNAERLFVPFQRFHKQSDFPGTGIGLATVQRIIARHGGRIWAEGATGKGAAFYFTL